MIPRNLVIVLFIITSSSLSCYVNGLNKDSSLVRNNSRHCMFSGHVDAIKIKFSATWRSIEFNVEEFGASGDGVTDDSQAFEKAWEMACSSSSSSVVLWVPNNKKYFLNPVKFIGPCKPKFITFKILGTLEAPSDRSVWNESHIKEWISFSKVRNLLVNGGGTIEGNGEVWWKNSCKRNKSLPCTHAPTALSFSSCNNLKVKDLNVMNSQQIHVWFKKCSNVIISKLNIVAPETSPNTDGIHISGCNNVFIKNTGIRTGDDCISIVSGSRQIVASNIYCGPGHGISIGSLGANNSLAQVYNVLVNNATLNGTTNGVRIKTWQGGHGYAAKIAFKNILMHEVRNPIIIDQNYCDSSEPCQEEDTAVAVSHVVYRNIKGTSASDVAINFDCSRSVPCCKIILDNINLIGTDESPTKSYCRNYQLSDIGNVAPICT